MTEWNLFEIKRRLKKKRQHVGIVRLLTMRNRKGRISKKSGGNYMISYAVAYRELNRELVECWHPSWAKRRAS